MVSYLSRTDIRNCNALLWSILTFAVLIFHEWKLHLLIDSKHESPAQPPSRWTSSKTEFHSHRARLVCLHISPRFAPRVDLDLDSLLDKMTKYTKCPCSTLIKSGSKVKRNGLLNHYNLYTLLHIDTPFLTSFRSYFYRRISEIWPLKKGFVSLLEGFYFTHLLRVGGEFAPDADPDQFVPDAPPGR